MDNQLDRSKNPTASDQPSGEAHAAQDAHPSITITATLELAYPPGQVPPSDYVQEYLRVQLNIPEPDDSDQPFTLRRVLAVSMPEQTSTPIT